MSNGTGTTIWSWAYVGNSFGEAVPTSNGYVLNLRYPGQYYDAESGMVHNGFRDYCPACGRYIQSDPIGLRGGVSTYAYVRSGPLQRIDALGLDDLNLFPAGSPQSNWANSVQSPPGVYTVGAHGNPFVVEDQNGNPLTPSQLASMIQADPNYHNGESIRLDSCNTGTDPGNGKLPFAQLLAFQLNADVSAPNNFGWTSGGQTMTIAPYANQPGINWQTVTQFTPNTGPDMSNQGSYITYYPPTIPTGPNVTEP